jgi:hypothetical protein
MRLFTSENLEYTRKRTSKNDPLHAQLIEIDALSSNASKKLGVLIDLDRDYRSLLDLPFDEDTTRRLFFRLLDVRILSGVLRAALSVNNLKWPDDLDKVEFLPQSKEGQVHAIIELIGGKTGVDVFAYSVSSERETLRLLNALLAADINRAPEGHHEMHSLTILAETAILVGGIQQDVQPLIMFDDGHRLEPTQREDLLGELRKRKTSVARWYAERFEALSHQELLSDVGEEGRDVDLVNLDAIAKSGSPDSKRFSKKKYDNFLADIATRRATPVLMNYAQESRPFLDLLNIDQDTQLPDSKLKLLETLGDRVIGLAGGQRRYSEWISSARQLSGHEAALKWRELEVLILRDQNRQQELFELELTSEDMDGRSSSPLRESVSLAVTKEFKLPYYFGSGNVLKLGSHNTQQFLEVCGDLFAEMLVDVSLGRPPQISSERQDRLLFAASERFWESIPRTIPNGRDVQAVVREIAAISVEESNKPTMPYPPGVTGTSLLMSDRARLLDEKFRVRTPGAERLFAALASAVAFNVLNAELDYSVKSNQYMVLYLNRLLCPKFGLPLGFGGFRERKLSAMIGWVQKLPPGNQVSTNGSFAI